MADCEAAFFFAAEDQVPVLAVFRVQYGMQRWSMLGMLVAFDC